MIAYTHYAMKKKICWYGAAFVFLLLGLLSKSMLVTWPFVFLLLDYWPLNRLRLPGDRAIQNSCDDSLSRLIREKIPFFALCCIFSGIAYWAQSGQEAIRNFQEFPFHLRFENVFISYVRYLGKIIFPVSLSVFYPLAFNRYTIWKFLSSLLFLIVISYVIIRGRYKRPYLVTGWFWYLGTLVPVIGIVHIGFQAMADRYTYLPSLGILLMAVQFGAEIAEKHRFYKSVLIAGVILATGIFMITSWVQTTYWKNSLTLYKHAEEVTNANPLVWLNYGFALETDKQFDLALEQYHKLMDMYPDNPVPWKYIGNIYQKLKQPEKAKTYLLKACQLSGDKDPQLLAMLSQVYLDLGEGDQAKNYLEKAIELAKQQGQITLEKQLEQFQKEIQSKP